MRIAYISLSVSVRAVPKTERGCWKGEMVRERTCAFVARRYGFCQVPPDNVDVRRRAPVGDRTARQIKLGVVVTDPRGDSEPGFMCEFVIVVKPLDIEKYRKPPGIMDCYRFGVNCVDSLEYVIHVASAQ